MSAPELVVLVAELTRPHTHRERYEVRQGATLLGLSHATRVPSLIVQLAHAAPSGSGEERTNAGYVSRPAARLEALDCLQRIDRDAAWWVRHLGEDDPGDELVIVRRFPAHLGPVCPGARCLHGSCMTVRRGEYVERRAVPGSGTTACVLMLNGLAAALDPCDRRRLGCCDRHELEHAIRSWWTQARIVTGWDSPAWRPDNTCPLCNVRGGLRVRLADQAGFCAECGETWTPETIALLADHIRAENLEDADQAEEQEAS